MPKFKVGDVVICDVAPVPAPVTIYSLDDKDLRYWVDKYQPASISYKEESIWRFYDPMDAVTRAEAEIRKEIYDDRFT
jgi:hypothetical protein